MSIDLQLYLLSGGLALLSLVATVQAFTLRKFYPSNSSLVGAISFLLLGSRQVYSFWRLKYNIADARAKGIMIDHLTAEQWIVGVLWAYVIIIGFILWMHLQRRDLKALGIG